jgi:hypothetical protein
VRSNVSVRGAPTHLRIVEGTQETLLPQLREGSLNLAACLRLDSESAGGFRVKPLAKLRLSLWAEPVIRFVTPVHSMHSALSACLRLP